VAEAARPADVMSTLDMCLNLLVVFPNITTLLKIFATLPVSTATAERSFSTLRRLKTYLRTSMGSERLNGLALRSIHRQISGNIDPLDVLDGLAKKPRRLDIII
jgi:hAT family C-terminal dimerisation region